MDLEIVLPLVRRALRPAGRLAVWRNVFGDEEADVTEFRRGIHRIVDRRDAPSRRTTEDADATADALSAGGLFAVERIRRYRWSIELGTDEIRGLFATFSDWSPEEVEEAASVGAALGGVVTEHYTSWLIVARPVG